VNQALGALGEVIVKRVCFTYALQVVLSQV